MKWYHWPLISIAILFVYEFIRRWGAIFFRKVFSLAVRKLKTAAHRLIVCLMRTLRNLYERLQLDSARDQNFSPMAPTKEARNIEAYEQVLLETLAHADVRNIALTGPYGSGKSSIISTFAHRHPEYNFLNISLAAIAEGIKDVATENEDNKDKMGDLPLPKWTTEMGQQIEYSILQQIFYHVTGRQIPFSRFRRIRTTSRLLLFAKTIAISLISLSVCFLFFNNTITFLPEYWMQWLLDRKEVVLRISWMTFAVGFSSIIYMLLGLYQHTQLIKLNLKSAELEISPNKDASILNKHLDEILYFFTVIPVDIVVIEDLDRFRNPEIFIKLREINTLINNSLAIKRKVTFLYALRDDVFANENRTKFFDFIAPVIPEINASNAAAKLHREIEKMGLSESIPETFLNDLGFFIQETRLLINITNEFRIYQAQLENFEVNYSHLLGIIVYKNKYPTDFSELQYNRGMVYTHFTNRSKYVDRLLGSCKARRKHLVEELSKVQRNYISGPDELRKIYISELYKEIHSLGFRGYFNGKIVVNGMDLTFRDLIAESNFNSLRNNPGNLFIKNYQGYQEDSGVKFDKIEKGVSEQNYESRLQTLTQILGLDKNMLERELEQVNLQIDSIRHYSMKEIMAMPEMEEIETPIDGHSLLDYLIGNGYIDETYSYYLSQFTEGEITKSDFDYIMAVTRRRQLDWGHPLIKLPALINRLHQKAFLYSEILNFDMAAYLVSQQLINPDIREFFLSLLGKLNDTAASFIDHYIARGEKVPELIRLLCSRTPDFWNFVEFQSNYTIDKKNLYLRLIVGHVDISDIIALNEKGNLSTYISRQSFLMAPAAHGLNLERIQEVCTKLNIFFDLPGDENIQPSKEMIDYMYVNNRYVLSQRMLNFILKNKLQAYDESTFNAAQYTHILQTDLQELKAYIVNNFVQYINDVFILIESHQQESAETILHVLNSESLPLELKKQVVSSVEFTIEDISESGDKALSDALLVNSRIRTSWDNIFTYYTTSQEDNDSPKGLNQQLVNFLNNSGHAIELSGQQIIADVDNKEMVDMLIDICTSGKLDDDFLPYYLHSMAFELVDVNFEHINPNQAKLLIEANKVSFTPSSVISLKQHHPELAAEWMLGQWGAFTRLIDELQLNQADWICLLKRSTVNEQKDFLLFKIPGEYTAVALSNGIAFPEQILTEKKVMVEMETLLAIAENTIIDKNSIALILAENINFMSEMQVEQVLTKLGGIFGLLTNRQNLRIPKSDTMERLLNSMITANYFVASFETKSKFIHVIPLPVGN